MCRIMFPKWWIRLRDLDGSYGLFVSYYYHNRDVTALHVQVWPYPQIRGVRRTCEGGPWDFKFCPFGEADIVLGDLRKNINEYVAGKETTP